MVVDEAEAELQVPQDPEGVTQPSSFVPLEASRLSQDKAARRPSKRSSTNSQSGLTWGAGEELTRIAEGSADGTAQELSAFFGGLEDGPQLLKFPDRQFHHPYGPAYFPPHPSTGQQVRPPSGSTEVPPGDPLVQEGSLRSRSCLTGAQSGRWEILCSRSGSHVRVRGRDASGRMVEYSLEKAGLTVTNEHNNSQRQPSNQPQPWRMQQTNEFPPWEDRTTQDHDRTLNTALLNELLSGKRKSTDDGLDSAYEQQGSQCDSIDSKGGSLSDSLRQAAQLASCGKHIGEFAAASAFGAQANLQPGSGDSTLTMAPETAERALEQLLSASPESAERALQQLLSTTSLRTASGDVDGHGTQPGSHNSHQQLTLSASSSNTEWDNQCGGSGQSGVMSATQLPAHLAGLQLAKGNQGRAPSEQELTRRRSSSPTYFDLKQSTLAPTQEEWRRHAHSKRDSEKGSEGDGSTWGHSQSSTGNVSQGAQFSPEVDDAEIDFDSLEIGARIGMGVFGEVFKAHWRQTNVAVKKFLDQRLSDRTLQEFKAEVQMNRRLRHPNIIAFLGACTVRPNLCIVTAWAPRGSLYQLLHHSGRVTLTERQKLRMALDIARGMHYLHSANPPIIHRDLKSPNLLVDNDLTIKVCDFGLARTRSNTWLTGKSQGGTPEWTAPEVLRSQAWNEKSDVYSYGVILFELTSGQKPWANMSTMQVVGAVGWGNARLEPPPNCPPFMADLMTRCWGEHTQRPSFKDIIGELLHNANKDRPRSGNTSTPVQGED